MNSERNRKIKFRILALFFNHTLISKVVLGKELFICSNLGLLKKNHKVMAQVECCIEQKKDSGSHYVFSSPKVVVILIYYRLLRKQIHLDWICPKINTTHIMYTRPTQTHFSQSLLIYF